MFKQIQYWISKIMNAGVREDYNFVDINRIQISNALLIFGFPLILLNTFNNIREGDQTGLLLGFVWLLFLGVPVFLNLFGKHHFAYGFLVFLAVLCADAVYLLFGKDVIVSPVYILGVLVVIFFFDKLLIRLILITSIVANYLFCYGYYLNHYPPLVTDTIHGYGIHLYFFFTVFAVTAITMKILGASNNQLLKTEKLNQKLENKNQELERFAYITSHDLKEPICNISRFSGLIKRKIDDDEIKEYLGFINENARYLDEMVTAIQNFMEISEENLNFGAVNFNEVTQSVSDKLKRENSNCNIEILFKNLPVVHGIKKQIIVLLEQLFDNAVKYNDSENPTIEVKCKELEDAYQFQIKDNGIGVGEEFSQRIFLPFKKLYHKSEYEGAGLGLSICRRVIENHNGKIWIKNNEDKGVSFYFTIPKSQ